MHDFIENRLEIVCWLCDPKCIPAATDAELARDYITCQIQLRVWDQELVLMLNEICNVNPAPTFPIVL